MAKKRSSVSKKTENNPQQIRGRIEKLHFSSPHFSAGKMKTDDGIISFAGKIFVQQDERVIFSGEWIDDPKWGRQFQVKEINLDMDLDTDGMIQFIAKHPQITGIGKSRAEKLIKLYGANVGEAVANDPLGVAMATKIPVESIETFAQVWSDRKEKIAVSTWLSAYGLTNYQVETIVEKLGNSAMSILKSDPYVLIGILPRFGFKKVDQIARLIGVPKELPGRIRAGIMYSVREEMDGAGHTWTEYQDLIREVNTLLVMDCMDSQDRIIKEMDTLLATGKLEQITHDNMSVIGLPSARRAEETIYHWLSENCQNPHFMGDHTATEYRNLNPGQLNAFNLFLRNRISLLSGGAGTGKTYTLSTIVSLCLERGLSVSLGAPTGKAARRMEQMVGGVVPAQTIHRLLRYDFETGDFKHGKNNPIETDVLIIDETSMVDIYLAESLINAISPDTAVLLVGDHNQLPPVGPGNILRDIYTSQIIPTTILTTPCRQAGILDVNCNKILIGEVAKTETNSIGEAVCPWHIIHKSDPGEILYLLGNILVNGLERLGVKDPLRDLQILTPTKKGPMGTKALNRLCQQIFQKKLHDMVVEPPKDEKDPIRFYSGDKVIQTKNNYDLGENGIMNGTIGVVKQITSSEYMIEFEGEPDLVCVDRSNNTLELAYALTIHKVQGSEFPVVISIIHKSHSFQHHRNLLYTAVTRARKISMIIGDPWGIKNCAQKIETGKRRTFLSLMLALSQGRDGMGKEVQYDP